MYCVIFSGTGGVQVDEEMLPGGLQARQVVLGNLRGRNRVVRSLEDALDATKYHPTVPSNAAANTR